MLKGEIIIQYTSYIGRKLTSMQIVSPFDFNPAHHCKYVYMYTGTCMAYIEVKRITKRIRLYRSFQEELRPLSMQCTHGLPV